MIHHEDDKREKRRKKKINVKYDDDKNKINNDE